jgi:signal transduction histidine kinase
MDDGTGGVHPRLPSMVDRIVRAAGPLVLAGFVAIGAASSWQPPAVATVAALAVVAIAALLAARSVTGWGLVAGCTAAAVAVAVICAEAPSNLGWFAVCVLAGWGALRADTRHAAVLCGVIVVILLLQWTVVSDESGWGAWISGTLFTTVACVMARRQRVLLEELQAAQASLADSARLEERTRIAREMHDVVGHALTVSLLHVTSARLALDEDPEEARSSLAEAERLGRQSLAEVRRAVGLLRSDEPARTAPLPGAGQLAELVESFRRAGTPVRLDVEGDPGLLSATEGLAVYRILQEALTNVVRHASGASAAVRLRVDRDTTRLTVQDDAVQRRNAGPTDGTGIAGMRERAEALGGRLTVGPTVAGWRVEATLPRVPARVEVS